MHGKHTTKIGLPIFPKIRYRIRLTEPRSHCGFVDPVPLYRSDRLGSGGDREIGTDRSVRGAKSGTSNMGESAAKPYRTQIVAVTESENDRKPTKHHTWDLRCDTLVADTLGDCRRFLLDTLFARTPLEDTVFNMSMFYETSSKVTRQAFKTSISCKPPSKSEAG